MNTLYEHLLQQVFIAYLQKDHRLLAAIERFNGNLFCTSEALIFTLPALFEFTSDAFEQHHGNVVNRDRAHYLRFRKSLYQQPNNSYLQQEGCRVELEQSHPNHDLSRYKLVRVPQ